MSRSEATRQLQYTEYFGDGDSKAYSVCGDGHVEKKGNVLTTFKSVLERLCES